MVRSNCKTSNQHTDDTSINQYPNTQDVNQVHSSLSDCSQTDNLDLNSDDSPNSYLSPSLYSLYSSNDIPPVLSRQPSTPTPTTSPTSSNGGIYTAEICADLRSAEKCLDLPLNNKNRSVTKRPSDPDRAISPSTYFDANIIPEKRLSDPQIRYSFYNKGFEAVTYQRKHSLTHCEMRRCAMPNINEQDSFDEDPLNRSDALEQQKHSNGSVNGIARNDSDRSLSSSSGRDITKLPKLKIRISDEMGRRIKSSFDDSDSDQNTNWFDNDDSEYTMAAVERICSHSNIDPFQSANNQNINLKKCQKCGHKLIRKQFTNSFI